MKSSITEEKIKSLERSNKTLREQLLETNYRIDRLRTDVRVLYRPIIDEKVKSIEEMQKKMDEMQKEFLRIIQEKGQDRASLHH